MRRLVRGIGVAAASAAALGIVAYGVVYALSERIRARTYKVPTVAVSIPTDPADILAMSSEAFVTLTDEDLGRLPHAQPGGTQH